MKALIIDDKSNEAFSKRLCQELGCLEDAIHSNSGSPHIIADSVVETQRTVKQPDYKGQELVPIIINIEGKFGNATRQEQKGVEILMWLRCKHKVCNPVVLYSFRNNEQLLKAKPESLIINSKGCYYFQLPYDFPKLKDQIFDGLTKEYEWERLKKFLKPAFEIEKFRHREANWWGAYRLFRTHKELQEPGINARDFLSDEVIQRLFSLEVRIALRLYENKEAGSFQLEAERAKKLKSYLKKIRDIKPKIIYVDDMANLGWSRILQQIIYGGESTSFKPYIPPKQIHYEALATEVLTIIERASPDVVLLDMRLFDETKEVQSVEEISGVKVLEKIKKNLPSVPVIMFSATNKSRNLKRLFELGCEGLWTKEGIDEVMSDTASSISYFELVELIYNSVTRYKYPQEKRLYATDIELSKLKKNLDAFDWSRVRSLNHLLNYDLILTDSMIWIKVDKVKQYHQSLYFLGWFLWKKNRNSFVLIDDVLLEIMRKARFYIIKNFDPVVHAKLDAPELILTSRYALSKILEYQDEKIIRIDEIKKSDYAARMKSSEYKSDLDADYSFKNYIPAKLSQGKRVLFICEDRKSKENIDKEIDNKASNYKKNYTVKNGYELWAMLSEVIKEIKSIK